MILLSSCDRSPDPIRAALGPDPGAATDLRLLTSADRGAHWTLAPAVIAHGVSSLHACTFEGTVWVPAVLDVHDISWLESTFPSPFVDVFRSADLVTWTADRIPVRSSRSGGIDPACTVGPAGLEMWFAEVEGTTGDPALGGRTSQIWRTHWTGDTFDDGDVVYTGNGLVDPAPIYIDGRLRLFLNEHGAQIVEVVGEGLSRAWSGVTVPQAAALGDQDLLLAQRPSGPGMLPVARGLTAQGLGAERRLDIPLTSCESPSMTTLGDTWLLFCVDASRRRPGEPGVGSPLPPPGGRREP